jgi:hypothetical protein
MQISQRQQTWDYSFANMADDAMTRQVQHGVIGIGVRPLLLVLVGWLVFMSVLIWDTLGQEKTDAEVGRSFGRRFPFLIGSSGGEVIMGSVRDHPVSTSVFVLHGRSIPPKLPIHSKILKIWSSSRLRADCTLKFG